ncbi:Cytosolic Fe-S cluster assembly factor NBP35 [Tritrichomonas foetus]|uniref:Cytosolic Fe-S cluster assembly factor NBP35 n=1 Tax=Tritrichomonas foetus TaxID=1144522 RepID=A0A1J4JDV8_9EUKA|nr:Cytosolic Fe-S cluster assembly factor NBP35 [Tritrichomonas foetus]|eukprot:OHS97338.1 Cytosolic Fe-S cluster assembly factor NBP35 [Tritrichomonas foetus]
MSKCSGNCENCSMKGTCGSSGAPAAMQEALESIKQSMDNVKNKILILSGKGGVGKSTITYLMSKAFSLDSRVGVLDLDLCGPSMPFLFNKPHEDILETTFGFEPCYITHNIGLISIQYLLKSENDALIARGPMKNSLILQFLRDVDWGETDTIIIDTPPGTSDEHLSVISFMADTGIDGAVIVTTPEELALSDVRREIQFCRKADVKILGVIENMSGFSCPKCGKDTQIYPESTGGARAMCEAENIEFLGSFEIDPSIVASCIGEKYPVSEKTMSKANSIRDRIMEVIAAK